MKSRISQPSSYAPPPHQRGGVLVRPEGLGDGPVSDGHARLRVGPHVDELVAAVPGLGARLPPREERLQKHKPEQKRRKGDIRGSRSNENYLFTCWAPGSFLFSKTKLAFGKVASPRQSAFIYGGFLRNNNNKKRSSSRLWKTPFFVQPAVARNS